MKIIEQQTVRCCPCPECQLQPTGKLAEQHRAINRMVASLNAWLNTTLGNRRASISGWPRPPQGIGGKTGAAGTLHLAADRAGDARAERASRSMDQSDKKSGRLGPE